VAEGKIQLFFSEPLLAELREVLRRRKFVVRLRLKQLTPETALARLQGSARIVPVENIPAPPSLRDPDDMAVLACAVSAGVDAIITGDRDLLSLKEFQSIPILTARDALQKLGISPP
jgi:putative PIN family toxin of toxin-antitoxin system